ncbi:MAG: phosphoribosyl-AMP cyclohydrolase [Thermomicrobiales bacterium]
MTLPIDFDAHPLIPAVIQDDVSRDVLMVGFMNRLAFEKTQETGFVHFWSRSRGKLWKKGETSGHTQEVVSIAVNCEDNSVLIQVIQNGAVCHTGHTTCFFRQVLPDGTLFETSDPVFDPNEVYETRRDRVVEDHLASIQRWFGAYEYLRDHRSRMFPEHRNSCIRSRCRSTGSQTSSMNWSPHSRARTAILAI